MEKRLRMAERMAERIGKWEIEKKNLIWRFRIRSREERKRRNERNGRREKETRMGREKGKAAYIGAIRDQLVRMAGNTRPAGAYGSEYACGWRVQPQYIRYVGAHSNFS
jgi:hypothetical protein